MKNEKFKVIQFIREFIVMIDKRMDNFPKQDVELKNRIRNNTYDILELAYEANVTSDRDYKEKLLYKIIAKIKVIDFLLNLTFDKKIITDKNYVKFGKKLDDIAKYVTGWLNSVLEPKKVVSEL